MILIFGSGTFGKTDHLPGLFYVKTRFYHLWWLPILPQYSILFVDDGTETFGMELRCRWKSVLTAWLRTIVGFAILALSISLVSSLLLRPGDTGTSGIIEIIVILSLISLLVGIYYGTYRFTRPGYRRALELAEEIGFPPEVVNAHFPVESAFEPPAT